MTVAVYETTARAGSRRREARAGGAEGADESPGLSLCHNGPQLPPATQGWPELTGTEAIGFRGRDAVELAAAFLPAIPAPKRPEEHYEGIGTVTVDWLQDPHTQYDDACHDRNPRRQSVAPRDRADKQANATHQ